MWNSVEDENAETSFGFDLLLKLSWSFITLSANWLKKDDESGNPFDPLPFIVQRYPPLSLVSS